MALEIGGGGKITYKPPTKKEPSEAQKRADARRQAKYDQQAQSTGKPATQAAQDLPPAPPPSSGRREGYKSSGPRLMYNPAMTGAGMAPPPPQIMPNTPGQMGNPSAMQQFFHPPPPPPPRDDDRGRDRSGQRGGPVIDVAANQNGYPYNAGNAGGAYGPTGYPTGNTGYGDQGRNATADSLFGYVMGGLSALRDLVALKNPDGTYYNPDQAGAALPPWYTGDEPQERPVETLDTYNQNQQQANQDPFVFQGPNWRPEEMPLPNTPGNVGPQNMWGGPPLPYQLPVTPTGVSENVGPNMPPGVIEGMFGDAGRLQNEGDRWMVDPSSIPLSRVIQMPTEVEAQAMAGIDWEGDYGVNLSQAMALNKQVERATGHSIVTGNSEVADENVRQNLEDLQNQLLRPWSSRDPLNNPEGAGGEGQNSEEVLYNQYGGDPLGYGWGGGWGGWGGFGGGGGGYSNPWAWMYPDQSRGI